MNEYDDAIEAASEQLKHCTNCAHRGWFSPPLEDSPYGCMSKRARTRVMERDKCDNNFRLEYAFEVKGRDKPYCSEYKRNLIALKADIIMAWYTQKGAQNK